VKVEQEKLVRMTQEELKRLDGPHQEEMIKLGMHFDSIILGI
jgi:hypothetical protein